MFGAHYFKFKAVNFSVCQERNEKFADFNRVLIAPIAF